MLGPVVVERERLATLCDWVTGVMLRAAQQGERKQCSSTKIVSKQTNF